MMLFLLRHLLLFIITLLILSLVSFSLLHYTPHSLIEPLISRPSFWPGYSRYLTQLLAGDWGVSYVNGQPILSQLKLVFAATLELCLVAFTLALLLGIPLGILAGMTKGKWQDRAISTFALIGFSMPVFWLALLLMLFFSLELGWLPVSGRYDLLYPLEHVTGLTLVDIWLSASPYRAALFWSSAQHMVLPILVLTLAPATEIIRLMRNSTSEVYAKNYIKVAATRGLSRITIIRRHLLHNALPPIISKLGLQFSALLTMAMMTEVVFNWPGLGHWLISAIRQQDYAAISAGVLTIGSLVTLVNICSDILEALCNPLRNKDWYGVR